MSVNEVISALQSLDKTIEFKALSNFEPLEYLVREFDEEPYFKEEWLCEMTVCIPDISARDELIQRFDETVNYDDITQTCKVMWYQIGHNETKSWYLIGYTMAEPTIYFLLTGSCCYTGFSASGSVSLCLSRTLDNLCKYGLTDSVRSSICCVVHNMTLE